jgi:hypothetical protein
LPDDHWRFFVSDSFSGTFRGALVWLASGAVGDSTRPQFILHPNHTMQVVSVSGTGSPRPPEPGR